MKLFQFESLFEHFLITIELIFAHLTKASKILTIILIRHVHFCANQSKDVSRD